MAFGDVLSWGAEVVSASIFVPTPPAQSIAELFELTFGEKPTSINEVMQPFGRLGQASLQGPKFAKILGLQQPGRIDVNAQGLDRMFDNGTAPPSIGEVVDAIDEISAYAQRLAKELDVIARLAINVRLVNHQRTIPLANKKVLEILPYKVILEEETDFILQVNSVSRVGGSGLNRIIKWSVEHLQFIAATTMGANMIASQQSLNQFFSAFAHIDFNTTPSHTMFSGTQASDLLDLIRSEVVRVRKNSLRFK